MINMPLKMNKYYIISLQNFIFMLHNDYSSLFLYSNQHKQLIQIAKMFILFLYLLVWNYLLLILHFLDLSSISNDHENFMYFHLVLHILIYLLTSSYIQEIDSSNEFLIQSIMWDKMISFLLMWIYHHNIMYPPYI